MDNNNTGPNTTTSPQDSGGGNTPTPEDTTTADQSRTTTTSTAGELQTALLTIAVPFIVVLAIVGVVVYVYWAQRRKRKNRAARRAYPGAHERGQGSTGSTEDLPASAAPMGEGLNELGEAPPPYLSPLEDDDIPKDNATTVQARPAQGTAGASNGEPSSSSPSSPPPGQQLGGPNATGAAMEQARSAHPPAYDAVMSQRVTSFLTPPTAVAGVTVTGGRA